MLGSNAAVVDVHHQLVEYFRGLDFGLGRRRTASRLYYILRLSHHQHVVSSSDACAIATGRLPAVLNSSPLFIPRQGGGRLKSRRGEPGS